MIENRALQKYSCPFPSLQANHEILDKIVRLWPAHTGHLFLRPKHYFYNECLSLLVAWHCCRCFRSCVDHGCPDACFPAKEQQKFGMDSSCHWDRINFYEQSGYPHPHDTLAVLSIIHFNGRWLSYVDHWEISTLICSKSIDPSASTQTCNGCKYPSSIVEIEMWDIIRKSNELTTGRGNKFCLQTDRD